jgi:hypothetical protein
MQSILDEIKSAFGDVPRPEHFTNYRHCDECAEHDKTLRDHTPDTIGLNELGNMGWNPLCFTTVEGYLYYVPGLARLALDSQNNGSYVQQFMFELRSERLAVFNDRQRQTFLKLLLYLFEKHPEQIGPAFEMFEESVRQLGTATPGTQS